MMNADISAYGLPVNGLIQLALELNSFMAKYIFQKFFFTNRIIIIIPKFTPI